MNKCIYGFLGLTIFFFGAVTSRASDDGKPTTRPTQEARIAELEAKLAAAVARIDALEAQLARRPAQAAPADKPPVKSAKSAVTTAKKVDESAGYFPKGTQVTGTMSSPKSGNIAMKGSVITRTATTAVLRMTNTFGTRDFEVAIKNGDAVLASTRVVSVANGGPPNQLLDIKIKGKADAETLKLSGTWHVKGPAGSYVTDVDFDLKAN